jgi:ectoine hydroxylase-related dioxygenase (phytanoyl-CoA dioxygenase family)
MGASAATESATSNLPSLTSAYALSHAQCESFRERGHVVVRGLASAAEVAAYRPAICEAGPKRRYDHRPLEQRDTYGKAFLQMLNLWTVDARVRAFVMARRFARLAAELLGVEAVRIYHDQALFKEPRGGFTPWHQDQFYWPLATEHTITLWLALVPVSTDMGPVQFASGSHRAGTLGDVAIGDDSERRYAEWVSRHGFAVEHYAPLEPGDATFHAGWTLHRAEPNGTDRMREAMTIIYFADGTRVGPLDHPSRRLDRDIWLAGCEPGELAAGPLNPVVYRRGD